MKSRRSSVIWWSLAAAVLATAAIMVFVIRSGAAAMPQALPLEKNDFMIFAGGYEAQVRDGFRPRSDVPPSRLDPPLDWNMDPYEDRNWRFQLHAWRMLNPIWQRWYGRDWQRLAEEIMPWVHDWYLYHVVQGRESDFAWYDMAAGFRAQHLAMLLALERQGQIVLAPEQSLELEALARLHVEKLRDPDYITHGNHAIIQVHGLRLLCTVWRDESCRGEEAYSARLMGNLLHSQFGEQGVHTENSPAYHLFALKKFSDLRPVLYPPIADEFGQVLGEARAIAPWFTLPDGRIAAMGDSAGNGMPFPAGGQPACTSHTPAGACIVSKDITAGGYAVVRTAPDVPATEASMLIVGGSSVPPGSHDHADELGFELYSGGRMLFVDAGKYSYNEDRWRDYFISDRAHNVVGLANVTSMPYDTLARGSALTSMSVEGGEYLIRGMVKRSSGLTHHRRISYRPAVSMTVNDRVELPSATQPVVYWHLAPGLAADVSRNGVNVLAGGAIVATMELSRGDCRPVIVRGREGSDIQGWVSRTYLERLPAAVVEYHCAPGTREIDTRIQFSAP